MSGKVRQITELMSVPEILEALGGVSRDTFYKWRQTGKGPRCFSLPNGELRCKRAGFLTWPDGLYGAAALLPRSKSSSGAAEPASCLPAARRYRGCGQGS
jgi:predicted DNA-binding transcriptional regulator AlpA